MKRYAQAVKLLTPPWGWIGGYILATTAVAIAVATGIEIDNDRGSTLWGLQLVFFGGSPQEVAKIAYLEMMYHLWTLVTMPMIGFVFLVPLVRSLRADFQQFLRYSASSPIFIEISRVLVVLGVTAVLLVPFAVSLIAGVGLVGFQLSLLAAGLVRLVVCTLFVCTIVFAFSEMTSIEGLPATIGAVTPFLLTGIATFLERSDFDRLWSVLPPGLPYTVERPHLNTGLWIVGAVFAARLVWSVATGFYVIDQSGAITEASREGDPLVAQVSSRAGYGEMHGRS